MSGSDKRRVCVVGAGTAGLCALKHSLEFGLDAVAYEQAGEVGGTWVYSEDVSSTPYEDEIQSSMYDGLRTNLPKEVMGYPDYPYPDSIPKSFISAKEVLDFLRSYTEHFQLTPHIKFRRSVIRVRPWRGEWEVYVHNLNNDKVEIARFDYIFVCNGHYTDPQYPQIEGMDIYRGKQMHSHLYRKASLFEGETVLIIGAGPSGIDIAHHLSKTANKVFLSHHREPPPNTEFMGIVYQKPDLECFSEHGAIFKDGSAETFSVVIFCTGYKYSFPFLTSDCGINVVDNCVQPLYKHCINIKYPSMALIGLPYLVLPTQTFDLQIRFILKFYTNQRQLPSEEEMLADLEKDRKDRAARGLANSQAHQMGETQYDYYSMLANMAGIGDVKPAISNIMRDIKRKYIYELDTYRSFRYKIIDEENFIKYLES